MDSWGSCSVWTLVNRLFCRWMMVFGRESWTDRSVSSHRWWWSLCMMKGRRRRIRRRRWDWDFGGFLNDPMNHDISDSSVFLVFSSLSPPQPCLPFLPPSRSPHFLAVVQHLMLLSLALWRTNSRSFLQGSPTAQQVNSETLLQLVSC